MIDEVMYEIRELTGQDYVNLYAGEKAETEPTVAARVASVTDVLPITMPDMRQLGCRRAVTRPAAHGR